MRLALEADNLHNPAMPFAWEGRHISMNRTEKKRPTAPGKLRRTVRKVTAVQSLASRLRLRDEFFRNQINPRQLLEAFDHLPGVRYFVKDAHSRLMALSSKRVAHLGLVSEEEVIGLTDREYLPAEIVDQFLADDQWVIRHGKPLRNRVEMGMDENGFRDWTITDKYPLFNSQGKVIGLIGTVQFLEVRRKMPGYLGPVSKAADFIRDRLGESLMLADIARQAGLSERQLQRLFRKAFGMTINQFIIRSRIQAAAHELTRSQRSIAEIALMFGFSDQSAFTNQFKSVVGFPPRIYRERYLRELTAGRK
jgi:AraC-like DNA-binding protein/PAS domain-containing protein